MIKVVHYRHIAGDDYQECYRPVEDSLPVATWRKEAVTRAHFYPLRGCHGGPLERPELPDRKDIP